MPKHGHVGRMKQNRQCHELNEARMEKYNQLCKEKDGNNVKESKDGAKQKRRSEGGQNRTSSAKLKAAFTMHIRISYDGLQKRNNSVFVHIYMV